MRRFNITVNGQNYDVAVEELGASASAPVAAPVAAPAPAPVAAAPAPTQATATAPAQAASTAPANAEKINTPMPGTIIEVKVSVGDVVKKNQPLVILEAMKMENEIVSTCDGTVVSVAVKKGDSVNTNDVLVSIG